MPPPGEAEAAPLDPPSEVVAEAPAEVPTEGEAPAAPVVTAAPASPEVIFQMIDEATVVHDHVTYLLRYFGYSGTDTNQGKYRSRPPSEVQECVKTVVAYLADMDSKLASTEFLCGAEMSAADCCLLSMPLSLYHITCMDVPRMFPNVWAWFMRCTSVTSLTKEANAPKVDAGVGYLWMAKNYGRSLAYTWWFSRNMSGRHLGNVGSSWYATCAVPPTVQPVAKPVGDFARACM